MQESPTPIDEEVVTPDQSEPTNDVEYQELIQKSLKAQQLLRKGRSPKKVARILELDSDMLGHLKDLQYEMFGDVPKRSYTTASVSDVKRKQKRKAQRLARKVTRQR